MKAPDGSANPQATKSARITDWENPRLPRPIRLVNALGGPILRNRIRLDPDDLKRVARRRTGLDDFGDASFEEPLAILVEAIERETLLSPFGRIATRQHLLSLLESRLRLEGLIRRHPEILEEPIERPIIIAGLPRTGTTHLFNLLSRDPSLAWLPYWESLEPFPRPDENPGRDGRDPRLARCARSLDFLERMAPLFPAMHEFTVEGPHEEIQLLALQLSTQLFEASYFVPSYGRWYRETDQTPAYAYLKRSLQALQFLRRREHGREGAGVGVTEAGGGEGGVSDRGDGRSGIRWLLKTPQHLENLGPLVRTFPDASFIQTHRDPVRITASLATMIAYGARMQQRRPDPRVVGHYWAGRVEDMLRASVDDRHLLPPSRVMDLRFDEFMKDMEGSVERIFAFCDQPFGEDTARRVRAFLDDNPKGKHGSVDYRLDDLGLDPAERREALRFYVERFGVPWD
jgi:hypothetical protein